MLLSRHKTISRFRPRTPSNGNGAKVAARAKKFVEQGQPYCFGGKNQMLCKANKSKVQACADNNPGKSNWNHILGSDKDENGKNWKWTLSEEKTDYVMIDCSGLTYVSHKEGIGVDIKHGSSNQKSNAEKLGAFVGKGSTDKDKARTGDLLWRSGHVAIVGENKSVIEAKGWKYGCVQGRSKIEDFTNIYRMSGDPGDEPEVPSGDLLSECQIRSAILFNKRTNQSICTKIQELVGVVPDGSFSKETILAIAAWQAKNSLEIDGKFGPKSKEKAGF